jgi:diguanylate cyclase (GGDEF)-like protein/PAS domain S-box-containing protein
MKLRTTNNPLSGLRGKSIFLVFMLACCLIAFHLLYSLPRHQQVAKANYQTMLKQHVAILSESLINPLLKQHYAVLFEQLDSQLQKNKQWKGVWVTNLAGNTLYPLSPERPHVLPPGDFWLIHKIDVDGHHLATVELLVNIDPFLHKIRQQQLTDLAGYLFALIFAMLIVIWFIERKITRPLSKLGFAFDQLSQYRYHADLPAAENNEIGHLINDFVVLRDRIKHDQEERNEFIKYQQELLASIDQSRQHLFLYREQSPIGILEWDCEGRLSDWNATARKLFAFNEQIMIGFSFDQMMRLNKHRVRKTVDWPTLLHCSERWVCLFELDDRQGQRIVTEWISKSLLDQDGVLLGVVSLISDITQRDRAEQKLKLSARVFEEAHEGIIIADAERRITDVNPMFCHITGYTKQDVVGKNPSILSSGKQGEAFYHEMWHALESDGHWQGELWNRKKSGELYAQSTIISTLIDDDGKVTHYIGLLSDITHKMQQQQALERLAHYDALTGLPNRTLFADRFQLAISHCKRNRDLLAVCFLDLDDFKPVNDQFGHEAGDQLLIEVSHRINACIREEDTLSRLGGDEFAMLLGGMSRQEECQATLGRISQVLSTPFSGFGKSTSISASIGYTIYPTDHADPDTLLRHADQAMYQAKMEGRNRCRLFDAETFEANNQKHLKLEAIEQALLNDQLCLFYQPKVNLKTGRVFGAEALIRWQHPTRGIVPPNEFLPYLDQTELDIKVGNWVIEQAVKQLSIWQQQGFDIALSINISPYHLQWSGFFEKLDTILNQYANVKSSLLQLEILESSVLNNLDRINDIVVRVRETLGISFALDDFGTGYSSLTHLRRLQVDMIKIDQGFVRDMLEDPDDFKIVNGVISLAAAFNREVVAEGVESEAHGQALMQLQCFNVQGYGIAKPMPAPQFERWLRSKHAYSEWHISMNKPYANHVIKLAHS